MVELRTAGPDDAGFFFQVYRENNLSTFAALGEEMCSLLLRQQSTIQESQYERQFSEFGRFVLLKDGDPVGRLYLNKDFEDWTLVDISVLPKMQKSGVGTQVLKDLITEARAAGCSIGLHVIAENPAVAWYRKLGFREVAQKEPYLEMVMDQ